MTTSVTRDTYEKQHLQQFLANCDDFQQMKILARRHQRTTGKDNLIKHIEWMENSDSYCTVDTATGDVDVNKTDSLLRFQMGQRAFNTITFFGSYYSDACSYNYYQLRLRESAKKASTQCWHEKWDLEANLRQANR